MRQLFSAHTHIIVILSIEHRGTEHAVETSHCGVSPTEGLLYVFVCECLADAFRDATM